MKGVNKIKKEELEDYICKHSPLNKGLVVKDEDKELHGVNKIVKRLYLGSVNAAKNKKFFEKNKIGAVLNCSKERDIPHYFSQNKKIEYMRVPVDDSLEEIDFELMYKLMPSIVEFIHKHVYILKQNVLVHCMQGRARSCIAVAAYLVAKCGMTPKKACKLIMDKRPESFFYGKSLNFSSSLVKYHNDISRAVH